MWPEKQLSEARLGEYLPSGGLYEKLWIRSFVIHENNYDISGMGQVWPILSFILLSDKGE